MKVRIIGPPGTGKTTRLMEILKKEVDGGVSPKRIAFLTFTRAAREEALARTEKTEEDFPYLRTIHAICYRELNISQDQIVRPRDLRAFGRFIGVKLNGNAVDPWVEEHDRNWQPPTRDDLLLQANHRGRHQGILLKESIRDSSFEIDYKYAVWFTKAYKAWKFTDSRVDYTDLLIKYLDHGTSLDIDTIFVDEAQDLSRLQWEVVGKLGARAKTWYIAGDDDQSIFNWAGADSSAFQKLDVDTTEILGKSYRVSKAVHRAAMTVASRIKTRLPKKYEPTASEGEVASIGYLSSLDFKEKTFVLFRNHYRGHELAKQLKEQGIPFIGSGSPLHKINVRIALLAWYKLLKKGEVTKEEAKKMLKFADLGDTHMNVLDKIRDKSTTAIRLDEIFINKPQWYEWPNYLIRLPGKDLIDLCIRKVGFLRTARPHTELMSIHQSKGREAHTVVLDTEISRAVYDNLISGEDSDDEHRVFYVGITRAKEKLFFILPDGPYSYKV